MPLVAPPRMRLCASRPWIRRGWQQPAAAAGGGSKRFRFASRGIDTALPTTPPWLSVPVSLLQLRIN